jgi:hypothetical protein
MKTRNPRKEQARPKIKRSFPEPRPDDAERFRRLIEQLARLGERKK